MRNRVKRCLTDTLSLAWLVIVTVGLYAALLLDAAGM